MTKSPPPNPAGPATAGQFAELLIEMRGIRDALENLVRLQTPKAPDYQYTLADFRGFNWESIDAKVIASDRHGPTEVRYYGLVYKRRSPNNNFGEAVFYSRHSGQKADGSAAYERLISFKQPAKVRPVPEETREAMGAEAPQAPAPSTPATTITTTDQAQALMPSLATPGLALPYLTPSNGSTLFWSAVEHFKIERGPAQALIREGLKWDQALLRLDELLPKPE